MKKENIYKLVEKGYIGGQEYNNFVSEFINNLNNEKYFEMADYIKELQLKTSKVSLSNVNTNNNEFTNRKNKFIFPKKLEEKTFLLQKGLKQNLIKNVLLIGRPGTGKTSYVEYMKNLLNLPLINVKFSDILDYKYGESIKKLENFMNEYRYIKCIIFFDEADSLFRKRGIQNDVFETDRIVSTMLKELDDDFKPIVFFASNLYSEIDKAIIRRIDEIINFNVYDYETLKQIWKDYSKTYKIDKKISSNTNIINQFIQEKNNIITPSDLKIIAKKIAILFLDQNNYQEKNNNIINQILNDYFDYRNGGVNEE